MKITRARVCLLSLPMLFAGCAQQPNLATAKISLPEARGSLSAERKANTKNDYALLLSLYGTPSSLQSSAADEKFPTRIASYASAGVNIVLVPHGCEEDFSAAMNRLVGYRVAETPTRCLPLKDNGWTIVAYIDVRKEPPATMSAAQASAVLSRLKEQKTVSSTE